MRAALLAVSLALIPPAAIAGTGLSAEIASSGLAATEARLAALPLPTDTDRFALGGLRFLGAVEAALQLRWKVGLTEQLDGLPVLRLPIPENPAPAALEPAMIADLFRLVTARMDTARAAMADIGPASDLGLEIDLADLWFDIDADGVRTPGEDMLSVAGPTLLGWRWSERDPATPAPVVRFDAADAAWLTAYTHLLSGTGETLLAYDPTTAISEVRSARAAIRAIGTPPLQEDWTGEFEELVDIAAITLRALDQSPDAARAAAAQAHFLAMIDSNRDFWSRAAAETDNDREWLPNDRQQSALRLEFPQGTGAVWMGVLSDAEAILKGEKLIGYIWLGDDAGVNVGRIFTDPRPIDVAGWIQGVDALPYLEKGTLVSPENMARFADMVSGDALLFMAMLN